VKLFYMYLLIKSTAHRVVSLSHLYLEKYYIMSLIVRHVLYLLSLNDGNTLSYL